MYRFDPDEEMDMVRDASDFLRKRIEPLQTPAEIRVKIGLPCRID